MPKPMNTRKQLRIESYDYSSAGKYFVTICTANREPVFAAVGAHIVRPSQIEISPVGRIVETAIHNIPKFYPSVTVDKYVIMPNHIHMIVSLNPAGNGGRTLCAPTLSRIIKQMKEYVTKQSGISIWQKGFYERVVRSENEYNDIWLYIERNPENREIDIAP
jgi:REP element-mobilizing transposase RayT